MPLTGTSAGDILSVVKAGEVAAGLIEEGRYLGSRPWRPAPVAAGPGQLAAGQVLAGRCDGVCTICSVSRSNQLPPARDLVAQPQRAGSSLHGLLFPLGRVDVVDA